MNYIYRVSKVVCQEFLNPADIGKSMKSLKKRAPRCSTTFFRSLNPPVFLPRHQFLNPLILFLRIKIHPGYPIFNGNEFHPLSHLLNHRSPAGIPFNGKEIVSELCKEDYSFSESQ